jgi:diaminohydroxyphosphoribosylaminopyrimidine deaminase / 5-amino-6-(5-phosphoribosylamino)uracil reductase
MSVGSGKDRLPYVTVKYAQTLDGRIATSTGESQWISGDSSLIYAHELRARHDAILVGLQTVLHDNPRLTVRLVNGANPFRIVVDTTLRIPLTAAVLSDEFVRQTIVATSTDRRHPRARAIVETGARVLPCDLGQDGRVDLRDLLRRLGELNIESVMVEGGSQIITSLLAARLVDRLVVCIAPKIVGAGVEAVGELGITSLSQAITFKSSSFRSQEGDIIFEGVIGRESRFALGARRRLQI